jgi:MATE family multidrug resistance protein
MELITIALPLVMVSVSENMMIFFDRIILSHYSLMALNSTTLASQAIEVFQQSLWAIIGISELLVARLYAQKATKEMSKPVWQMIYLSLFMLPFIFLLSKYSGYFVLPKEYQPVGLTYYKILMYSIPLTGIIAALAGFFVGQGKTVLIVFSSIVTNIINLILDFILIFGIKNIFPAMGAAGAAISAIISLTIQIVWLFLIYFNKNNRHIFKTTSFGFNLNYFLKCIRIGLPMSLGHAFEMSGWLFIIHVVARTGLKNFTIISIGSTLYLIYACLNDGLYRALATTLSNHFSTKNEKAVRGTFRSSLYILSFILFVLMIPIILVPNLIIHLFNLKEYVKTWSFDIKISFIFILIYFLFSGIYWIFGAILTAKYHTKFIMIENVISIWLVTALPIYIIATHYTLLALYIWPLMCAYVILGCIGIFIYYKLKIAR